ncbi:MAG: 8-oxoguanine DNA glycosylase [Syntrophaceae bacterium]|nr:8-oxoguanine DNA glycosylase [Syntrophaceae bacterium]
MTGRLRIDAFSLHDTLSCGQFFRFTRLGDTYLVQSSGRIFSLHQRGDLLFYKGVEEPFLIHFFRLDEDLDSILKEVDRDPIIHEAIQRHRGLRLIRQDPWECLLSFLCSSAKAIPHIRSIVEELCRSCGKRVSYGNYLGYGFPEPRSVKTALQLRSVRAGFRIDYLTRVFQSIDRTELLSLKDLSYRDAKKRLMCLSGVGKKIADCVLLYSLDFLEAFPIDTWIKKGLQKVYFGERRPSEKEMEAFVSSHFGPFAGYAQLYLYHFWRHRSKRNPLGIDG